MLKIYLYILDTMADWEIGHVTCELNSKRFFKKDAPEISFKTVGISKEPIKTMGGLKVIPDCLTDDIETSEKSVLLLPGADTWSEEKHGKVIQKALEIISRGGAVCAICGATVALAQNGLLDNRTHTSNGEGFLEMFCPTYKGTDFYVDEPSVRDENLITASATGSLLWAKQIIELLDVFDSKTLEAWHAYFSTGKAEHFFKLMQSMNQNE